VGQLLTLLRSCFHDSQLSFDPMRQFEGMGGNEFELPHAGCHGLRLVNNFGLQVFRFGEKNVMRDERVCIQNPA